jgi:hypothetical protein
MTKHIMINVRDFNDDDEIERCVYEYVRDNCDDINVRDYTFDQYDYTFDVFSQTYEIYVSIECVQS